MIIMCLNALKLYDKASVVVTDVYKSMLRQCLFGAVAAEFICWISKKNPLRKGHVSNRKMVANGDKTVAQSVGVLF